MTGEDKEFIRVKELKSNDIENDDTGIGLFGKTPAAQPSSIGDPIESIAANNTAIDSILAALRVLGIIAT